MNNVTRNLALLAGIALFTADLEAQQFNAGSNGSYGALNVTQNTTLEMPPDGVFHCTTISISSSATLRFTPNVLNTPVYLLATGDVTVNGTIEVSGENSSGGVPGRAGPGGFSGGYGGFGPSAPANRGGDGHGPGRGINVSLRTEAAYSAPANQNSNVYGNVLIVPMVGGSGGAGGNGNPGPGGGGGGGAILIASNTRITVNGNIRAIGGYGPVGSGSGGAIRLVAPTGGGAGNLHAQGQSGASGGRVRIDTQDVNAFRSLTTQGATTRGTRMFVFPPTTPKLHIVEAAGAQIPVPSSTGVSIELPPNAPTTQSVRLRGEGFTGNVPIQLVVVPEHSASSTYDLVLNAAANPPEVSVNVTLPVAEPVRIEAWTK